MPKQALNIQPQDYAEKLLQLTKLVLRLRKHSTNWQTYFGSNLKAQMQDAENKIDNWIQEHIIEIE